MGENICSVETERRSRSVWWGGPQGRAEILENSKTAQVEHWKNNGKVK